MLEENLTFYVCGLLGNSWDNNIAVDGLMSLMCTCQTFPNSSTLARAKACGLRPGLSLSCANPPKFEPS